MTHPIPRTMLRARNVPYGSETILILGESAETRAFCREALSGWDYHIVEAANFQHAEAILDQLENNLDLILACAASDAESGALALWYSHHWTLPLLVLELGDDRERPTIHGAEIALKVRLALEAARPSRSILIVDEDESERGMIADLLGSAGYEVREARNGKQAMAQITADAPELLLTDIVMPEKDGLELLQEVRQRYPNIVTIAMSGTTRADRYLDIACLLGAKGTLEKPLSIDQLLRVLRELETA